MKSQVEVISRITIRSVVGAIIDRVSIAGEVGVIARVSIKRVEL